ncbi:MAG: hypothetical protein QXO84_02325 [Candidatus Aenigmatarchaeota archaeon]
MEEQEIIKKFLDLGVQLTNEAFSMVKKDPDFFLAEIKKLKPRPFFITKDILNKIIEKKERTDFRIIKTIQLGKKALRVEDYANFYLKKYEKIKEIFVQAGYSGMSINKIGETTKEFWTIGVVKEKKKSSLVLEDPTGEIDIFFDGIMRQKIDEFCRDDVVAVFCEKIKDRFVVKKISHPDIPLSREVKKTKDELFVKIEQGDECVLSPNKYISPAFLQLDDIVFLLLPRKFFEALKFNITSEDIAGLLKKRFLLPSTIDIAIGEIESLVLTELPDIIVTDLEPSLCKNYKGTTIISVFDKSYEVNLHTREVKEL